MLEAKNLSKSYGPHWALKGLSVQISAGEIFCFLGANGAGKTTTINLFLGFADPSEGEAFIDGKLVSADPIAARQDIAYIPEQVALYPELTGYENLEFFAKLAGKNLTKNELLECLYKAGLPTDATDKASSSYSKGMRQKVGIAIAVAKNAKVLLLDEPLSGLDPKAANEFCSLISELRDQGVAILMATHDLFRAKEISNRIGIMKAGKLIDVIDTKAVTGQQLETLYLDHMHDHTEAAA